MTLQSLNNSKQQSQADQFGMSNNQQQQNAPQTYLIQNYAPRRPALSTSKVPSNNNINTNKSYNTNTRLLNNSNNNLTRPNHFSSSECLLNNQQTSIPKSKLKQNFESSSTSTSNSATTSQANHNQSNISASISSSIISSSTSTSGFVSGSNSISNSISLSSSKSNDFLNPNDSVESANISNNKLYSNRTNSTDNDIKSGSVSSTRSIYELAKMRPLNESQFILNQAKTRITSFQPGLQLNSRRQSGNTDLLQLQQKSNLYKKIGDMQASNSSLTSSQYYIDTTTGPISSSSRHTSTNSSKVRNSTSTVLVDHNESNKNANNRKGSITEPSKRLSHQILKLNQHQKNPNGAHRNSNYCETEDLVDDEFVNELEDGLNYDEDDDIFDYNENPNEHVNKQYHNSLSTASCIANEINCLNTYNNITPDSSTSASSSSFSSSSVQGPMQQANDASGRFVLNLNSQKYTSPTVLQQSVNRSLNNNNNTTRNQTLTQSHPATPDSNLKSRTPNQIPKPQSPSIPHSRQSSKLMITTQNQMNRQYKVQISPNSASSSPPALPTTTQSFFMLNSNTSNDFSLSGSLANFSHFDIQSIFFSYANIKSLICSLHTSMNIKTGASAASRQSSLENLNKTLPPIPIQSSNKLNNLIKASNTQISMLSADEKNSKTRLSSSLFMYEQNCPASPKTQTNKPTFNLSAANDSALSDLNETSANQVLPQKQSDLVEECNCFRLEIGGDAFKGLGLVQDVSQRRMMKLNSINIMDKINSHYKKEIIDLIEANNNEPFTIEYQDWGSYYYRYFFQNQDHANYLGLDREIGPIAISIRRDKLIVEPPPRSNSSNTHNGSGSNNERIYDYAYRFIMRTSDLNTLRGTILEDHVVTKSSSNNSNSGGSKGLPHKEVLAFLMPELNLSCLRLAEPKVAEKLIELDEQYLIKNHKIGVLLCKSGQSTEEEMYNNKDSTPAFDEFLQLLGEKINLKGFQNYRGGLDNTSDTTGTHSVYTKFRNKELMFHVSTLLPFSTNDKQQLTRKRHIGNDLVTIVFQEPGSLPFSPKTIRSQYQHIFIIVRALSPNSFNTQYSVAVSYSKDIPAFGPPLPKNPLFLKSKEFREFLLAKIVNADNVGLKCEKFTQIRMRTRSGTLKDLVDSFSTKFTLDNCGNGAANTSTISQKLGLFNFGSIKQKKLRSKSLQAFNASLGNSDESNAITLFKMNGSIFWNIEMIEDFQYLLKNCCLLGISKHNIVVVDAQQKCVLFSIGCNAVIGWTLNENENSFVLYFDLGECVNIKLRNKSELNAVVKRLEFFTKGCKTIELSLEKKDCGPLGFNIHHDGVVTEVEPYSLAFYRGLKQGTRIVKIGDHFVINLNHMKMIDLLRNSACLKVTFLMPFEDGSARRGQDDSFSLYAYLSTCSSLNERQIDSIKTTPILTNFQKYNRNNLPSVSMFSPQKNRRLTASSNISKLIHRLSTSGSISGENVEEVNNNSSQSNNNVENKNVFSNSLYFEGARKNDADLVSIQSPKKIFTNNSLEWSKMVQTASKAFENAHRSSDNTFFNDSLYRAKLNSTANNSYYSKAEKSNNKNDLKECIEQNLEKNASYDELKERLLHLQLELNKEKQEKSKIVRQEATIREEYLNLQQEYMKIKEKLVVKEVLPPSTPTSRRYSVKSEFIDCGNDFKNKQGTTPQVLRINNNETFFPTTNRDSSYTKSHDGHI